MNTVSPSDLGEFCSIAFQQLPVGMAFVDSNGRIEQLNQALADLTGITFDELIGRRFGDLFEPGPAAEAISLIERFAGDVDLETKSFELPLRRPDRSSLTVALTLTPIRDAGGHAQHIVALLDDVTRERAAETALRTEKERFRLAIEVGRFEIWDYNPNTEIVVIKGHQEDETVTGLPAGRAAEWLAERFHPDDLREANAMFQRGLHAPRPYRGRFRIQRADEWSYATVVGRAFAGENGASNRLITTVVIETEEWIAARKAWHDDQQRLSLAIKAADMEVWEYNPATREMRWEGAVDEAASAAPQPLDAFLERIHPDDRDKAVETARAALDGGGDWGLRLRLRRRGEWRHVAAHGKVVPDGAGRNGMLLAVVVDITAQMTASEELHQTRERLLLALDATDTEVWEYNPITQLTRQFGAPTAEAPSPEPLPMDAFAERIHPDDREEMVRAGTDAIDRAGEYSLRFRLKRNGVWRWMDALGRVVPPGAGPMGVLLSVVIDATNKVEFGDALLESQERLLLALEAANMEILDFSPRLDGRSLRDAMASASGQPPDPFMARIEPDDRPKLFAEILAAYEGNGNWHLRFRMSRDGEMKEVAATGRVILEEAGETVRIIAVIADIGDIGERIAAVNAVRASRARLLLALDAANMEVWENPIGSRSVNVERPKSPQPGHPSPAPTTWEQLIAEVHPDDREAVITAVHGAAPGDAPLTSRFRMKRDGGWRWMEQIGGLSYDEAGNVESFVSVITDVHDRQQSQSGR